MTSNMTMTDWLFDCVGEDPPDGQPETSRLEAGDWVRLRTGRQPMVVERATSGKIWARYLTSSPEYGPQRGRAAEDFVLVKKASAAAPKKEKSVTKLYQTKSAENQVPQFGTYLATNSKGEIVLEIKGTGAVEAFKPEDVEEVRPHTVGIRVSGQPIRHYEIPVGVVERGDVLILRSGSELRLAIVTATDTKKTDAGKSPGRLYKLASSAIILSDTEKPEDE